MSMFSLTFFAYYTQTVRKAWVLYLLYGVSVINVFASTDPKEQLYACEIFGKPQDEVEEGSETQEEGKQSNSYILIISSEGTWKGLEDEMKKRGVILEDRFAYLATKGLMLRPVMKEKKVSESQKMQFFYQFFEKGDNPLSRNRMYFDTNASEEMLEEWGSAKKRNWFFRIPKEIITKIDSLEESEKEGCTIFGKGKNNVFRLMSIKDYHDARNNIFSPSPTPVPIRILPSPLPSPTDSPRKRPSVISNTTYVSTPTPSVDTAIETIPNSTSPVVLEENKEILPLSPPPSSPKETSLSAKSLLPLGAVLIPVALANPKIPEEKKKISKKKPTVSKQFYQKGGSS